jgi:hypothetical protein
MPGEVGRLGGEFKVVGIQGGSGVQLGERRVRLLPPPVPVRLAGHFETGRPLHAVIALHA